MNSKYESENSFYRLGDIDILTFMQDDLSNLWKFYLSTDNIYVVSKEFDKSHGMYANAPDEVIRRGLMDFSASLIGEPLSVFAIMDLFIDRCFNDNVFDKYTTDAIWFSIEPPSYEQMEDILSTYSNRILWVDNGIACKYPELGEYVYRLLYKTPSACGERTRLLDGLRKEINNNKISAIYLNKDGIVETLVYDKLLDNIPIFIGEFTTKNGEEMFESFKYIGH